MRLEVDDGTLDARLQVVADRIDAGTGGLLQVWSGTQPATKGGSTTGCTLLGEIPLAHPCGTVESQALSLTVPVETLAVASGQIGWCRLVTSAGAWRIDCDASDTEGTGVAKFLTTQVFAGGTIRLTSAVFG